MVPVLVLNQGTFPIETLMAPNTTPNSKVAKAFSVMNGLGVSSDQVKPVLQKLLKLYDKNWDYIEEDNYRTLADAYFESKQEEVMLINVYSLLYI